MEFIFAHNCEYICGRTCNFRNFFLRCLHEARDSPNADVSFRGSKLIFIIRGTVRRSRRRGGEERGGDKTKRGLAKYHLVISVCREGGGAGVVSKNHSIYRSATWGQVSRFACVACTFWYSLATMCIRKFARILRTLHFPGWRRKMGIG